MSVIENAKDLATLIQKYSEMGLYRKIVELEDKNIELLRQIRKLAFELEEAQEEMQKRKDLRFLEPYYWQDGDSTPFCAKCWEGKDKMAVHLTGRREDFDGVIRECNHCKTRFREEI
jgi:hypothetical protein